MNQLLVIMIIYELPTLFMRHNGLRKPPWLQSFFLLTFTLSLWQHLRRLSCTSFLPIMLLLPKAFLNLIKSFDNDAGFHTWQTSQQTCQVNESEKNTWLCDWHAFGVSLQWFIEEQKLNLLLGIRLCLMTGYTDLFIEIWSDKMGS